MNAATHAAGLVCAIIGAYAIVRVAMQQGGGWEVVGCSVYAFTLVAVYAASTLSHVFYSPGLRHAMRIADQAMIYLFIAGSFAPAALVWMRDGPWWILHAAM